MTVNVLSKPNSPATRKFSARTNPPTSGDHRPTDHGFERHGVDTASVHVSYLHHTARFVCTTDDDLCQIGSFYAGAMHYWRIAPSRWASCLAALRGLERLSKLAEAREEHVESAE